jgi:putative inorganic carbon (HCO3(-)) transporter
MPVAIIGGLLSCIALVLTGCRGAYIGLFFELLVVICVIYKFLKPQLRKAFTALIGFCVLALSFIIVSTASLRARIFSIFAMRSDSSNSFRFNVYQSCIQMFKDNWLLGIGCGNQNFREVYGLYMKTGFDALSAYNIYLETAVESGIFALTAFISFLGINIYKSFKFIFSNKTIETIYVLSALLSIIGILTHGFVDTVFFRPQIQFTFWIMVGIIGVNVGNIGVNVRGK